MSVASPRQDAHKEEYGLELAPRQAPRPCGRYARIPTRAHKLIQASRAKPGQSKSGIFPVYVPGPLNSRLPFALTGLCRPPANSRKFSVSFQKQVNNGKAGRLCADTFDKALDQVHLQHPQ